MADLRLTRVRPAAQRAPPPPELPGCRPVRPEGARIDVGSDTLPDVVLEVDSNTM